MFDNELAVEKNLVEPQRILEKCVKNSEPLIFLSGISVFGDNTVIDENTAVNPSTSSQRALREMEKIVLAYEHGYVFRRAYLKSEIIGLKINKPIKDVVIPIIDHKILGKILLVANTIVSFLPKLIHIPPSNELSLSHLLLKSGNEDFDVELNGSDFNIVGNTRFCSTHFDQFFEI